MVSGKKKSSSIEWSGPTGLFLLILGLAAHLYLVNHFNFTQDDAYISFRYALNFLDGHGLVYNIGERVEGFTNFLWTIIIILAGRFGLELTLFSKIAGTTCGLLSIIIAYLFARDLFAEFSPKSRNLLSGVCGLLLGTVYSFAYWAVGGLETAAFALAVLLAFYFYFRNSLLAAPVLVMATLLRPEGGLVFVFIAVCELIRRRRLTSYLIVLISSYILFLLPFAFFKYFYYGSLLPNPFYAKTSFGMAQVVNGAEYVGRFFMHYPGAGLFFLPLLIGLRKSTTAVKMLSLFLLIYLLYIIVIGGDVLKVHRFFIPLFSLMIPVIVYGVGRLFKNRIVVAVILTGLLAWQMYFPYEHVSVFNVREKGLSQKMNKLINELKKVDRSDFSIAASTIGLPGYKLIGHTMIDLLGLTDSTIARHPQRPIEGIKTTWRETHYNSPYLLSRQPDYILFSTGFKPSAPAEKALFHYSAFLNNYRTIGFSFGGRIHAIFKNYYPVRGEVKKDVDWRFEYNFSQGINTLWDAKDYVKAGTFFKRAISFQPTPDYPYVYYYLSIAQRQMADIEGAYNSLKKIVNSDTLAYEGYKDMYLFEYRKGNIEAAQYYRGKTSRLVPWYMARLDTVVLSGPSGQTGE